jgi:hypothetical protein
MDVKELCADDFFKGRWKKLIIGTSGQPVNRFKIFLLLMGFGASFSARGLANLEA